MLLKYNIEINNSVISNRLKNLVNQIYKLLPVREEGSNWQQPLTTIIQQLAGIQRLLNNDYSEFLFPLLSKLEGLFTLTEDKDFLCYRKTIFECLNLMNSLKEEISSCLQNY